MTAYTPLEMQTDDTTSTLVPEDEHQPRGDDDFHLTLDEAIAAMRDAGIPFLIIGGIASAVMGRDRGTRDVDLFVRPEDARRTLEALECAGFETKVAFPHWLYKGFKRAVLCDVIFRSSKDVLLDDEMLRRAQDREFRGHMLPIAPPEDLLIYAQSNDLVVPARPIAELMMLGGYEAAPQPKPNGAGKAA